MGRTLALFLFGIIFTAYAADPQVFPTESIVPQCATLQVVWGQPPPLHLHVQPDNLINVTNLVDLGLQNGTSTTYQVNLPIGQNFTFAYNTIANQFTVFLSNMMQVGPGNTSCLAGSQTSTSPPATSSPNAPSTTPSSSSANSDTTSQSLSVPSSSSASSSFSSSGSSTSIGLSPTFSSSPSSSAASPPASSPSSGSTKVFPSGVVGTAYALLAGIILFL
ncbi:hypothetical protein K438DRAFT_1805000 [Mycena galopus ATCC 62051]|nr:hypothetical protein K438DRAFT_1805000 [Mycena galopus ATCC 62051]